MAQTIPSTTTRRSHSPSPERLLTDDGGRPSPSPQNVRAKNERHGPPTAQQEPRREAPLQNHRDRSPISKSRQARQSEGYGHIKDETARFEYESRLEYERAERQRRFEHELRLEHERRLEPERRIEHQLMRPAPPLNGLYGHPQASYTGHPPNSSYNRPPSNATYNRPPPSNAYNQHPVEFGPFQPRSESLDAVQASRLAEQVKFLERLMKNNHESRIAGDAPPQPTYSAHKNKASGGKTNKSKGRQGETGQKPAPILKKSSKAELKSAWREAPYPNATSGRSKPPAAKGWPHTHAMAYDVDDFM